MTTSSGTARGADAALDTFVNEPLPADHPLWRTPNTIITPHLGGFCDVYVDNALPQFETNLRHMLDRQPDRMINLEARQSFGISRVQSASANGNAPERCTSI